MVIILLIFILIFKSNWFSEKDKRVLEKINSFPYDSHDPTSSNYIPSFDFKDEGNKEFCKLYDDYITLNYLWFNQKENSEIANHLQKMMDRKREQMNNNPIDWEKEIKNEK